MYLITGATGFIGTQLLNLLNGINKDFRIISRHLVPGLDCVILDFNDLDNIPDAVFNNVDTVIHLAGIAHDLEGFPENYKIYQAVNVHATIKLAESAAQNKIKKFIFVSSTKANSAVLSKKCMSEVDSGGSPEGVYGKTKREAELRLLKIGKKSGMHVSIIRPSLVYGPNVKGNLQLMSSAINNGWFPPLPETGNRRSMIHVDDLVRAILLVVKDKRANGEIFIATDGIPHSSREIYNAMCNVLGKSIPKWSVPKFLFDMISLINPRIKYKVDKLLGNECYSSEKLEKLGFRAQRVLKEMNETNF